MAVACMYVRMYVLRCVSVCTYVHNTQPSMDELMRVGHTNTCTYTSVHTYVCTYLRIYTHTTYIHKYIHTCTPTQPACLSA